MAVQRTRKNQKSIYKTMLIINVIALIFGVLYLFMGSESIFWNIYGIFIFAALLGNLFMAYQEDPRLKRGYFYLGFFGIFMLLIPLFNSLSSFTPTHYSSRSIVSCVLLLALFLSGGMLAIINLISNKTEAELLIDSITLKNQKESHKQRTIKTIIIVFLSIILTIGLAVTYNILVVNEMLWVTEVFISGFSLFYAFLFLSVGLLIIKLLPRNKSTYIRFVYSLLTLIVFIVCLLPQASVPFMAKNAEEVYTEAFGEEYLINPDFNTEYFKKVKFSIPEYFFGTISKGFNVSKDIPFYSGTEGVDKGLNLYFDVYTPNPDGDMLPGGNSVLIRIHGGGWVSGDKGFLNNAQTNRYFASKGYVVFDIQYGLSNKSSTEKSYESPYGDFTIDDMVRHIGKFLQYLVENSEEYNANTDSVFISGGSAGGNLALAAGLGYASGKYDDILDSEVNISGLIPFYPANALAYNNGIGYSEEFIDPSKLVDEFSPPCLVFQGSHDGIVKYFVTEQFKEAYKEAGNEQCAIIPMPFGGHAFDMYFPGYYNQLCLYYMERFMYQYR